MSIGWSGRRQSAGYTDVTLPRGNCAEKFDVVETWQVLVGRLLRPRKRCSVVEKTSKTSSTALGELPRASLRRLCDRINAKTFLLFFLWLSIVDFFAVLMIISPAIDCLTLNWHCFLFICAITNARKTVCFLFRKSQSQCCCSVAHTND